MLGDRNDFNRGLHCTGDLNPDRRHICHFPRTTRFGRSARAMAATRCSEKCLALRIGSYIGGKERAGSPSTC